MNNSNLVKFTLNLTLTNKLRNSPTQSLVYSGYIALWVFHPLKEVHYNGASFNPGNITGGDLNLHLSLLSPT